MAAPAPAQRRGGAASYAMAGLALVGSLALHIGGIAGYVLTRPPPPMLTASTSTGAVIAATVARTTSPT